MSDSTNTRRFPVRSMAGGAIAAGAAIGGYLLARREARRWRATPAEVERAMPLDDEVADPTYVTNRAVTIHAPPGDVWPWLAQMGELPRAGYYSHAWVERVMGMRIENADRIIPELQQLEAGQALDRAGTMLVKLVEPERCLVLGPPRDLLGVQATWALGLYGADGTTRLVSRVRARLEPQTARDRVLATIIGPGQFIMERRMLGEIRRLAERETATAGAAKAPAAGESPAGALKGGELEC